MLISIPVPTATNDNHAIENQLLKQKKDGYKIKNPSKMKGFLPKWMGIYFFILNGIEEN